MINRLNLVKENYKKSLKFENLLETESEINIFKTLINIENGKNLIIILFEKSKGL